MPAGTRQAGAGRIAHFWFVTIHPLDDGNGRIGRAITDMAIAQAESAEQRFYSLSSAILRQRRSYYDTLERTQKGDQLDITGWLLWFLDCHKRAIEYAEIDRRAGDHHCPVLGEPG